MPGHQDFCNVDCNCAGKLRERHRNLPRAHGRTETDAFAIRGRAPQRLQLRWTTDRSRPFSDCGADA